MQVKLTSERASHNWAGEQDARPNDLSGSRENGLDDELNQSPSSEIALTAFLSVVASTAFLEFFFGNELRRQEIIEWE